jgi:excinuclease ABC subunit C
MKGGSAAALAPAPASTARPRRTGVAGRVRRAFDRKFGPEFLASVPAAPGVYRFYDDTGTLLYVGKARDLRRRLAQYRTTRRVRVAAKRRALVTSAASLVWEVCASERDAALRELRLIQALRPRDNVDGAFPFLYPYVGILAAERETYFCLTTSPRRFEEFTLHGAFRSRAVTREAFFALRRLLGLVGHPIPRHRSQRLVAAPHSHVFGVRRLPEGWPDLWGRALRGASREAIERLALRLLEHAGARARRGEVQDDLRSIARFFDHEACALAAAIAATAYDAYPVSQRHRDRIFLRYRRGG